MLADRQSLLGYILFGGILLAILVTIAVELRKRSRRAEEFGHWREHNELATIRETIVLTSGGGLALVLMVLHNILIVVTFFTARTVLQETVMLLGWIGGNLLLGLGVALGRRRTYTAYRGRSLRDDPEVG